MRPRDGGTRVCDAVGVAAAKTWVNVFAEGEEAAWCDLSTVDGAARCRLAREIRDEIDLGLPPEKKKSAAQRERREDDDDDDDDDDDAPALRTSSVRRRRVTPRSRAMGGVFARARGRTDGTHGMARRRVRRSALSL